MRSILCMVLAAAAVATAAEPVLAGGLFLEGGDARPVYRLYRPFQDTRRFSLPSAHYQPPIIHRYHYRRRPIGWVWGRSEPPDPPLLGETRETLK